MLTKLNSISNQALFLAQQLLREEHRDFNKSTISSDGGVYLIYGDRGRAIYVGKARNLQRRILMDHYSGEKRDTTSAFRRSVHERHGVPFGRDMRQWILKHCHFAYA